ncbi:MAG: DUF1553 domain-containing protein [Proteobacteria bacterium]|nr:DUF1553 domain-containing protein [Pseudomonadota bacterium]
MNDRIKVILSLLFAVVAGTAAAASPALASLTKLTVEPAQVALVNADQLVQLLVTAQYSDGTQRDVTRTAAYTVTAPKSTGKAPAPASITTGRVVPQADGTTSVQITFKDLVSKQSAAATVPVQVTGFTVERRLNYANDILPILTKASCNSGGCHGKQGGQNGFALSLLGFDPDFDYNALTREGHGRRITLTAPDQSLLLTKAAGVFPHGGGAKLDLGSDSYQLLRRWIVQGTPKGRTNDPVVQAIEVIPRERILIGTKEQQVRVVARYSDGSTADVTRAAEYKSQQPDILIVEHDGLIRTLDRTGEGAVMVRYMGLVDVTRITVPYSRNLPESAYANFKPKTYVDELVMTKWRKLGIAPSELCTDAEFIRRASLDAIGTLPTAEEVRTFLADKAPDKRDRLVTALLDRKEYADYWAGIWGDVLRNKRRNGEEHKRGTFAFAAWIQDSMAQNKPYDQFVREILTAQGNVSDNPTVVWYREVRNTVHQVNDTAQLFLGTRVSCANCHNHPYEKMTQDDYWGMAAFFSRLGVKQGEVSSENAIFVRKDGETRQPRTGKTMKPKGLGGPAYDQVRGEDPRAKLADWMAEPTNPYFSRALVNRIWAHYLGVGLVEGVDDMRLTNPPSNPALLDALAKDFVAHKFDLKQLMRTIMTSQVYGLSATPNSDNHTDKQNYARYFPRRLPAQALLDAVDTVTGSTEKYAGFPLGTRAIELPDEFVPSYFLDVFGRSKRETACECERSYAPNLAQSLHLMNSPEIQSKISDAKGNAAKLAESKRPNAEIMAELYLRAFSRPPSEDELAESVKRLAATTDRRAFLEDFTWMLVNSKEFVFNH